MSWSVVILLSAVVLIGNTDNFNSENQKREVILSYTGNMGVLIRSQNTALWIDGLHDYYGPEYLNTPDTILQKAHLGRDGFSRLKLILFSHFHRDHFSRALTNQMLQDRKGILVAGPHQVVDSFPVRVTIAANGVNGEIFSEEASSLTIKAFDLPHTWAQHHAHVQNLAYLVEIEGIRILHVGDAETDEGAFINFGKKSIDVAIVPVWFLSGKKGINILKSTGASLVIATHIDPRSVIHPDQSPGIEVKYFKQMGDSAKIQCR